MMFWRIAILVLVVCLGVLLGTLELFSDWMDDREE